MRALIIVSLLCLCACQEQKSNGVSIRFNTPHCKRNPDKTVQCTLMKLPEHQQAKQ